MHLRPSLLASLLAVSLGLTNTAQAQGLVARLPGLGPTSFTFTNTTLVRYRGQNFDANPYDDRFFSLTERLDGAMQAPPWRLYLRVDGIAPLTEDEWNHTFFPSRATSCPDQGREGSQCPRGNLRLERLQLTYRRGDITLELGDFYQVFGRGVALAFRKVDPIGLDTALHGGRFEWDHGRVTLRGFGGLANPQNLDPITLSVFSDPYDLLGGGSATVRLGADEDLELSVHGLHVDFENFDTAIRQRQAGGESTRTDAFSVARLWDDRTSFSRVTVGGVRVELPALLDGDLNVYVEGNALHRETDRSTGSTDDLWGRGIYANAQLTRGRWTFLLEWKDYTHYLIAPTESVNVQAQDLARLYSSAPSLERDDQRPRTNANARGGRFRVDFALQPTPWIFTFNTLLYGWAESFDDLGNPVDPWDSTHSVLASHSYFAVRRRSRPAPSVPPPGGADAGSAQTQNAGASSSVGGANIAAGGVGGASATRVSTGDYSLSASVGYRVETHLGELRDGRGVVQQEAGQIEHESVQFDVDWAFPVGSNDSLELRVDQRFERNWSFDRARPRVRGGLALTWSHGLPLVVSAMVRWDNTERGDGDEAFDRYPLGIYDSGGNTFKPILYPSAEVRWNFSLSNFVRVFGGMTPGGRVCSGGVCRDVPLFQGAIAELVLRL